MLDKISALMPLFEKKFKLKHKGISNAEEFKAALQQLHAGTTAQSERYVVEGELNGRPAIAVLVLK